MMATAKVVHGRGDSASVAVEPTPTEDALTQLLGMLRLNSVCVPDDTEGKAALLRPLIASAEGAPSGST